MHVLVRGLLVMMSLYLMLLPQPRRRLCDQSVWLSVCLWAGLLQK